MERQPIPAAVRIRIQDLLRKRVENQMESTVDKVKDQLINLKSALEKKNYEETLFQDWFTILEEGFSKNLQLSPRNEMFLPYTAVQIPDIVRIIDSSNPDDPYSENSGYDVSWSPHSNRSEGSPNDNFDLDESFGPHLITNEGAGSPDNDIRLEIVTGTTTNAGSRKHDDLKRADEAAVNKGAGGNVDKPGSPNDSFDLDESLGPHLITDEGAGSPDNDIRLEIVTGTTNAGCQNHDVLKRADEAAVNKGAGGNVEKPVSRKRCPRPPKGSEALTPLVELSYLRPQDRVDYSRTCAVRTSLSNKKGKHREKNARLPKGQKLGGSRKAKKQTQPLCKSSESQVARKVTKITKRTQLIPGNVNGNDVPPNRDKGNSTETPEECCDHRSDNSENDSEDDGWQYQSNQTADDIIQQNLDNQDQLNIEKIAGAALDDDPESDDGGEYQGWPYHKIRFKKDMNEESLRFHGAWDWLNLMQASCVIQNPYEFKIIYGTEETLEAGVAVTTPSDLHMVLPQMVWKRTSQETIQIFDTHMTISTFKIDGGILERKSWRLIGYDFYAIQTIFHIEGSYRDYDLPSEVEAIRREMKNALSPL